MHSREIKGSNPLLRIKDELVGEGSASMSIEGTILKTALLTLFTAITAVITWYKLITGTLAISSGLIYGAIFVGLILAIIITIKKNWSPYLAPIYAIVEGFILGIISLFFEQFYPGIVFQAIFLTFGVLIGMLLLYTTRIIRVTNKLRSIIFGATAGIAIYYLIAIILGVFGIKAPLIYDSGWLGIGFSLFVTGVAAFNFLLDFDFIERAAASRAPKYIEWYAAFGVLVTLIWVYIEILNLLSKLRDE